MLQGRNEAFLPLYKSKGCVKLSPLERWASEIRGDGNCKGCPKWTVLKDDALKQGIIRNWESDEE